MFSANIGLAALSKEMAEFEEKAEIYNSFWTSLLGFDAAGIF